MSPAKFQTKSSKTKWSRVYKKKSLVKSQNLRDEWLNKTTVNNAIGIQLFVSVAYYASSVKSYNESDIEVVSK